MFCCRLFESCYWHCYGKWQFDEDIALYEDEVTENKDVRGVDNLAFWDSVSMLARQSAIIMQPSPSKLSLEVPITFNVDNSETQTDSNDNRGSNVNSNLTDEEKYIKYASTSENGQKNKLRKKSAIEEMIERKTVTLNVPKERKKSLKERRNSTADLTLDLSAIQIKLDNDLNEVPIIRQGSVPKFYDSYTPEHNPFIESSVLASPMIAATPQFDLKSVVQIENEIENAMHATKPVSRMANIRKKIKPILIKKPSTKSLPDSINHI